MLRNRFAIASFCCLFLLFWTVPAHSQPLPGHHLLFRQLPTRWDEALPLGNGLLGCLVWEKNGRLRLSLDRADLWDDRPMAGLQRPEFSYNWVAQQVANGQYEPVQQYFDVPYEREAAPTKLPGAALEFDISTLGPLRTAHLDIATGLCTLRWQSGVAFSTFVHATQPEGWYKWSVPAPLLGQIRLPEPNLVPPAYGGKSDGKPGGSVAGDDLARLGYEVGKVVSSPHTITYTQRGFEHFTYLVSTQWRTLQSHTLEGLWRVDTQGTQYATVPILPAHARFDKAQRQSAAWWQRYWNQSSVQIPDTLVAQQYYRDLYKWGCVARAHTPIISLQAIWTADNGRLPPWKGDFHHDLNTQMSYWPAYTANHLSEAAGFVQHLQKNEAAHRAYTKQYFATSGLNVPGVETISGQPMGGWIQYACSPTASAWLAQHVYWQWAFGREPRFLAQHAYPFLTAVAQHLAELTDPTRTHQSKRVLPLSSSPEIGDNSLQAWFPNTWTNYDLALAQYVFQKTAELAEKMGKNEEAAHWRALAAELPPLAQAPTGALDFAPQHPYRQSHRHFSHLMAIYPLGLVRWEQGPIAQRTIHASLQLLDSMGTQQWTGYSFAWQACLQARARSGTAALHALRIFASAFTSPNSFHLNGDQSGLGYSSLRYRPFTLEGNFAAAAAVHEMLVQQGGDTLYLFPALPAAWRSAAFRQLRTEGGLLVSAAHQNGHLVFTEIYAPQDGRVLLPLTDGWPRNGLHLFKATATLSATHWEVRLKKGGRLRWQHPPN